MMSTSMRVVLLFVIILAGGALVNGWAYLGEKPVTRKDLQEFPQELGKWSQKGSDEILDDATLKVLRASDYLLRDYRTLEGRSANFYVGYYATQSDGSSYHSPLNCLPGSGWTLSEPGQITFTGGDGREYTVNRYVIQSGDYKSLMLYWYQGRGRAIASEYWGKVYTVIDSVRLRRSDGAMIRVTVPVSGSEDEAQQVAMDLAVEVTKVLPSFVPN
jgi:EpsI family protein